MLELVRFKNLNGWSFPENSPKAKAKRRLEIISKERKRLEALKVSLKKTKADIKLQKSILESLLN